jgi:Nucleotidyl transferase AbiEii toxin, Type IV TA system
MTDREGPWHPEVIDPATGQALRDLREASALDQFYLAGGTGLALRLGHRRSIDLDFFSSEAFDEQYTVTKVQATLHTGYSYPVLFPMNESKGVRVADSRDIACMKISAIAGRGTKRDFIDLYVVSKDYKLASLLELFREKFAQANYSTVHLLKSLVYFEEAEKDPMPDMLAPVSWEVVTQFLRGEVPQLR